MLPFIKQLFPFIFLSNTCKKSSIRVFSSCPELKVGQYVTSLIDEVKNSGRVVYLSMNPSTIARACAETKHGWNLTNLLPGLLVKATIKKVRTSFTLSHELWSWESSFSSKILGHDKKSHHMKCYSVSLFIYKCQVRMLYKNAEGLLVCLAGLFRCVLIQFQGGTTSVMILEKQLLLPINLERVIWSCCVLLILQ